MSEDWLNEIEARVREAAAAARKVRGENATLKRRVAELEKRTLSAATAASDGSAEAWAAERQEVRRRLERLVEHLENLVENSAEET